MAADSVVLYHAPRSRSSRFIRLLEELEAPYELRQVTIRRGDGVKRCVERAAFARAAAMGDGAVIQTRSKIAAMPWPPPMHMVTSA